MTGRLLPYLPALLILLAGSWMQPARAQTWSIRNPIPTTNSISGIRAVDRNLVLYCGNYGEIGRTTDGGATWTRLRTGTGRLRGISGGRNGLFVVGDSGAVLFSADTGDTWTAQQSGTTAALLDVSAVDARTAFASGEGGVVIKTTDGGAHWTLLDPGTTRGIRSLSAVDGRIVYATTSRDSILRTADGGATWERQFLGAIEGMDRNAAGVKSVSAVSADTAFAVGYDVHNGSFTSSAVFRTTDAGAHWVRVDSTGGDINYSVSAVNGSAVFVGGGGLDFMATQDGGATWLRKHLSWLDGIYVQGNNAISAVDARTAFASGEMGVIFATDDGGKTWLEKPFAQTRRHLSSIFAVNRNLAFACGEAGTMLRSADGGLTWSKVDFAGAALRPSLYSIVSPDGSLVLVASYNKIFRSTDGGAGFSEIPFGTPNLDLLAVATVGTATAYAVGTQGSVFKSVDAGATWKLLASGTTMVLRAVQPVEPLTVYAGGDSGVLLKSVDGGAVWKSVPLGVKNNILSLHFLDADVGYVSGANGLLAKTVDGGEHWTFPTSGIAFHHLCAVRAIDGKKAFVAGSGGFIARTDDGGSTWIRQATGVIDVLRSLSVSEAGTLLAAGTYGAILRSNGDGVNRVREGRRPSARSPRLPGKRNPSPAVADDDGSLFNMNGRKLHPEKPRRGALEG